MFGSVWELNDLAGADVKRDDALNDTDEWQSLYQSVLMSVFDTEA